MELDLERGLELFFQKKLKQIMIHPFPVLSVSIFCFLCFKTFEILQFLHFMT
jgi:hypothetical protein